jgi:hypothetical protein
MSHPAEQGHSQPKAGRRRAQKVLDVVNLAACFSDTNVVDVAASGVHPAVHPVRPRASQPSGIKPRLSAGSSDGTSLHRSPTPRTSVPDRTGEGGTPTVPLGEEGRSPSETVCTRSPMSDEQPLTFPSRGAYPQPGVRGPRRPPKASPRQSPRADPRLRTRGLRAPGLP